MFSEAMNIHVVGFGVDVQPLFGMYFGVEQQVHTDGNLTLASRTADCFLEPGPINV